MKVEIGSLIKRDHDLIQLDGEQPLLGWALAQFGSLINEAYPPHLFTSFSKGPGWLCTPHTNVGRGPL